MGGKQGHLDGRGDGRGRDVLSVGVDPADAAVVNPDHNSKGRPRRGTCLLLVLSLIHI